MDSYYNDIIEKLKHCGYAGTTHFSPYYPLICDEAASAIRELLNNLKSAKADNKRWKQICEAQNKRIDELEKRLDGAE